MISGIYEFSVALYLYVAYMWFCDDPCQEKFCLLDGTVLKCEIEFEHLSIFATVL